MLSPFELVQYSLETEEPLRDSQGLCIRARPGTGLGNLPRCAKGGELWASLWLEQATRSLEVADAQWWRLQSSARPCIPGLSAHSLGPPSQLVGSAQLLCFNLWLCCVSGCPSEVFACAFCGSPILPGIQLPP